MPPPPPSCLLLSCMSHCVADIPQVYIPFREKSCKSFACRLEICGSAFCTSNKKNKVYAFLYLLTLLKTEGQSKKRDLQLQAIYREDENGKLGDMASQCLWQTLYHWLVNDADSETCMQIMHVERSKSENSLSDGVYLTVKFDICNIKYPLSEWHYSTHLKDHREQRVF